MSDQYIVGELATIADSLKRLAAVSAQEQTPQSSVQIEQAVKPGAPPRITVKCYAPQAGAAAEMAQRLYDQMVRRYAVQQEPSA